MAIPSGAWRWALKNAAVAKRYAARNPVTVGSYGRWAATGAGLGAIRGMADNVVGDDKVSVMGGMISGAMLGASARGVKGLWGAGKSFAAKRRGRP